MSDAAPPGKAGKATSAPPVKAARAAPAGAVAAAPARPALQAMAGNQALQQALGSTPAQMPGGPKDGPAPFGDRPPWAPGTGRPLDPSLRVPLQHRFGAPLDAVRVHTGSDAAAAATALNADAFTQGRDIAFGPGAFAPHTPGGQALIAHEVAHVVQQSRGIQRGPTASLEREADDAARAALDGRPVRALSPGGRAHGHAVHRNGKDDWVTRPPPAGLGVTEYVDKYSSLIVAALNVRMSRVNLHPGSPYARWAGGSPATFMDRTWVTDGSGDEVLAQLRKMLQPVAPERFIDQGRDLQVDVDDQGNPVQRATSRDQWYPNIPVALGNALTEQLDRSLQRITPRYVSIRSRLKRNLGDPKAAVPEPAPTDVTASHPLDRLVIAALCAGGSVEVDFARHALTDHAYDELPQPGKPRPVAFQFQGGQGAWYWLRVTDPPEVHIEEVAATLYGDTDQAFRLVDASPLFGFTGVSRLKGEHKEKLKALAADPDAPPSAHYKHAKGLAGGDFEPGFLDPVAELIKGPLADEAALNQAANLKTTTVVDKDTVLDRMRISAEILASMQAGAELFHGGAALAEALLRLQAKRNALAAADDVEAVKWDAQSAEQQRILSVASSGVGVAVSQLKEFMKAGTAAGASPHALDDSVRLPLFELAGAYLRAASQSHLVGTARALLAAADQRSRTFSIEVMEGVLRSLSHQIEVASEDKVEKDKTNEAEFGVDALRLREQALREKLSKAREDLLRNPDGIGPALADVATELADLQTEVAIVANLDAIDSAQKALFDTHSLAADLVFHEYVILDGYLARAQAWRAQWAVVHATWKRGDHDAAREKFRAFVTSPAFHQFFEDTARYTKDVQTWNVAARILTLVAITAVTMGVGAYVGGLAATAWGAAAGAELTGGAAMAAFVGTTVSEAATFTTLNTLLLEENPTWKGALGEFAWNLALFGTLRKFTSMYRSAEMVKAATAAGKTTAVAAGGMGIQYATLTIAGLTRAEVEKRLATGRHLDAREIETILVTSTAMFIGISVAGRLAEPFMMELNAAGSTLGARLRLIHARRATLKAMADTVKTSGFMPAARKLMEADRAELQMEVDFYGDLLKNPGALAEAKYTPAQIEALRTLGETQLGELALAVEMSKTHQVAQGVYTVPKDQMPEVLAGHRKAGSEVKLLSTDPQSGAQTWSIIPKGGTEMRLTPAELPAVEAANFRHGALRPSKTYPGNVEMDLLATAEGETVTWGQAYIGIDARGRPNPLEPPELDLENRIVLHGRQVKVSPPRNTKNLTTHALGMLVDAHTQRFGVPPENLGGSLDRSNLLNFQREYAKIRVDQPHLTADAAAEAAVAKISFGTGRAQLGYTVLEVKATGEQSVDLGAPLGRRMVPTEVKVAARKPPPAGGAGTP